MPISFLIPILAAGSALIAIPIIIHLVLRKKPRHLTFPAFRYLQQRSRSNLRKLRLRHLLLLALRMLVILFLSLGLARPLLTSGAEHLGLDHPLAVVLVFDTSPSMEYEQDGKSRLDEAKELAQSILDYLPADSQIAVVDTAESGVQFHPPRVAAQLLRNRRIRPGNRPVTASLEEVFSYLEKHPPELPVAVVVFSDRTAASWNADAVPTLVKPASRRAAEALGGPVPCLYYDLGAQDPRNVALTGLVLRRSDQDQGTPLEDLPAGTCSLRPSLQALIQVTGASVDTDVSLWMDGRLLDSKRLVVTCQPGQSVTETVTFQPLEFPATEGYQVHQGEVRIKSRDLLPGDNIRYYTLSISQRRALIVSDRPGEARDWQDMLESLDPLPLTCTAISPGDLPQVLSPDEFAFVCVLNLIDPGPTFWPVLQRYVRGGGSVVVMPSDECRPEAYSSPEALAIMPARLLRKADVPPPGSSLVPPEYSHPILAPFKSWERPRLPGLVFRHWEVELLPGAGVVLPLGHQLPDKREPEPAIVERLPDPQSSQGRVLVFTTPLYRPRKEWNTIWDSWTCLGLTYATARYLVGARDERNNFTLRDDIRFWLPQGLAATAYALTGPETSVGEIRPKASQLSLTKTLRPGNYRVAAGDAWQRHFSVNLAAVETMLLQQRPAVTDIEDLLGPGSVVTGSEAPQLHALLYDRLGHRPSVELLPWIMIAVLILFALEGLLANRFYRSEQELPRIPEA